VSAVYAASPLQSFAEEALTSETPSSMSLEQALNRGFSHNPQWQLMQTALPVATAQITAAAARLNPSLIGQTSLAEQNALLGLQQTFRIGGERETLMSIATAQKDQVAASIKASALDLRFQVWQAYVGVFMLQQQADALESLLTVSKTLVDVTDKREKAGDVAKLDVWQVELQALRVQNQAQVLHVEVQQAQAKLNLLLDYPVAQAVTLVVLTPPPAPVNDSLDPLIAVALDQRPELEAVGYQYQEAKSREAYAIAQRIPDLTLAAGPAYSRPEGKTNLFFNVQVQLPLFYQYQGERDTAKAQQVQATQQKVATENQIKTEVAAAFYDVRLQHQLWQRYQNQLLPKAQHVNEKAALSFKEGKSSILVPLQAQQAYIETRLGSVQALGNYYIAWSRLERAVGGAL